MECPNCGDSIPKPAEFIPDEKWQDWVDDVTEDLPIGMKVPVSNKKLRQMMETLESWGDACMATEYYNHELKEVNERLRELLNDIQEDIELTQSCLISVEAPN